MQFLHKMTIKPVHYSISMLLLLLIYFIFFPFAFYTSLQGMPINLTVFGFISPSQPRFESFQDDFSTYISVSQKGSVKVAIGSASICLRGECHRVASCCSHAPHQRDARLSHGPSFKTNLFEDECQTEREIMCHF